MSKTDFLSVIPLFILTSAAILILFSIAVKRNHKVIYVITTVSLAADFGYLVVYKAAQKWIIEPLFIFDGFGTFNTGLILLTALAVTMISYAYFEQREERKEEYYILLILATLGAVVLVISKHFVSLFLGFGNSKCVALFHDRIFAQARTIRRSWNQIFNSCGVLFCISALWNGPGLCRGWIHGIFRHCHVSLFMLPVCH